MLKRGRGSKAVDMGKKMTSLNFAIFISRYLGLGMNLSMMPKQETVFFLHLECSLILRFDRSILSCGIFS